MSHSQTVTDTPQVSDIPAAHKTNLTDEIVDVILVAVNSRFNSSFSDLDSLKEKMRDCSWKERILLFDANFQLDLQLEVSNVDAVGEFLLMYACVPLGKTHSDIKSRMDTCKRTHWAVQALRESKGVLVNV